MKGSEDMFQRLKDDLKEYWMVYTFFFIVGILLGERVVNALLHY